MKYTYRDPSRYNIFLREYKTVYFFVPKVASTSFKKTFSQLLGLKPDTNYHKVDFNSVLRSSLDNDGPFFKFTFVRNPYDRLVSCYFEKVIQRMNFAKAECWKTRSFEDFIKIICDLPDEKMNRHFRPQHTFVTNSKGVLLVDYVGKFENINEDFQIIKKRAGFPDNLELPHHTKSKHSFYSTYFTSETKKLVAQRYAKDLEMFNYSF